MIDGLFGGAGHVSSKKVRLCHKYIINDAEIHVCPRSNGPSHSTLRREDSSQKRVRGTRYILPPFMGALCPHVGKINGDARVRSLLFSKTWDRSGNDKINDESKVYI